MVVIDLLTDLIAGTGAVVAPAMATVAVMGTAEAAVTMGPTLLLVVAFFANQSVRF